MRAPKSARVKPNCFRKVFTRPFILIPSDLYLIMRPKNHTVNAFAKNLLAVGITNNGLGWGRRSDSRQQKRQPCVKAGLPLIINQGAAFS